ncbi:hypothetical protein SAMN05444008_1124 [Cnuella takakiae]|uniref:Uncharacterized protein n=1 Tax=Cnuella takakiae TaxID=1302690 RepID=A0A1M5EDR1_9BACT|nr:hypothetical protein [Cnuella takakiae]OLY91144.1 hypothetical protein BUE76_03925 [Cnuella takakiae]SHF77274.1 hypothetical protein SAMN05444008_1124 [Cnuella takakiae]
MTPTGRISKSNKFHWEQIMPCLPFIIGLLLGFQLFAYPVSAQEQSALSRFAYSHLTPPQNKDLPEGQHLLANLPEDSEDPDDSNEYENSDQPDDQDDQADYDWEVTNRFYVSNLLPVAAPASVTLNRKVQIRKARSLFMLYCCWKRFLS